MRGGREVRPGRLEGEYAFRPRAHQDRVGTVSAAFGVADRQSVNRDCLRVNQGAHGHLLVYLAEFLTPGSCAVACASLDAVAMESCKAHATCLPTPDEHCSSLQRKAHGPRGSVEGQLRVNVAVLIGCQVSAGWHVQLRIRVRSALTSRDGTMAEHRVVVQQCGGWWRAASEGRRVLGNGEAGHATCRAVLRGSACALGITEDFR